jgi:NAD-dependent dihydropyrimidine dehydrogenase PreA subunit
MKKAALITILALTAIMVYALINVETEISGYRGVIETRGEQTWLKENWGDEMRLLLAPKSVLDTLGLALAAGDSVYVEGIRDKDLFLVGKLWNESDGGNLYWLRQLDYSSVTTGGESTYNVDKAKCIGCRLCVAPCPTGAITVIKGKATIDAEKCTECGICIEGYGKFKGCPTGSISKE